jgi:diguanylate cyclase (GGDEF)-like protein
VPFENNTAFLLVSRDPALLSSLEPLLLACGGKVQVVLSLHAALHALHFGGTLNLIVVDAGLEAADSAISVDHFLDACSSEESSKRPAIVLISDSLNQHWSDRVFNGVLDDLLHRNMDASYWLFRIQMVLRAWHNMRQLEMMRESQVSNGRVDQLTRVYNRKTVLTMLLRETDRVQRMKSPLSLLLLDIDHFGHWNSRLGNEACDELLRQVAKRLTRLLRTYDLLGRPGMDEFLIGLPGCSDVNAIQLAERVRVEVFCSPFQVGDEAIRLSACFGIASSQGRSPVVVLREAEQALAWARATGPETVQCYGDGPQIFAQSGTWVAPGLGNDLLAE